MKQKISIRKVVLEINGIIAEVRILNETKIQIIDLASDSIILSINKTYLNKFTKQLQKHIFIEASDIAGAMIFHKCQHGTIKTWKQINQFLHDTQFLNLCLDPELNYIGKIVYSKIR